MIKIKILIPAYNEEKNIPLVIQSYAKYGEVVVCDNGSTDKTGYISKKSGAKVVFEGCRGKGHTVRRLLKESADIYVLVDGDDAFYPSDCEKMIQLVREGSVDMVIGKRVNINQHNNNSIFLRGIFLKMLLFLFNLKFKKYLSGKEITDFMSGYRVFNNKVRTMQQIKSNGFDIETEITIQTLKGGFSITEIPVKVKPRGSGVQKSNIFNVGFPVIKRILFS